MVFKIRDKSLFWTRAGWKNNWEPKILNRPRPINAEYTQGIRCRYDHHSFLRMVQSYRNYSRICKQYLYGDKRSEEAIILEIRNQFKIPIMCETHTDLIKHGGERRFADQLDRDYELMTYNQHPAQLFLYRMQNKNAQKRDEEMKSLERGEPSLDQQIMVDVEKQLEHENKRLQPGERISLEKLTEVILNVARVYREKEGYVPPTSGTGEFNDLLEQRRPFTTANQGAPST